MDFEAFERAARDAFASIPETYREGVDGLVVHREALPHPTLSGVYTLGHCLTESYPSEYRGPESLRSVVALYWGSFRAVARGDPGFDWQGRIWETLTHELRHHLEALADDDALGEMDYALDQSYRREDGMDFDPWYYQRGERVEEGVYRVGRDVFVEKVWREEAFEAAGAIPFSWHGRRYRFAPPAELGDIHFVRIRGVDTGPWSLEVVLVRHHSWWEDVRRLSGTYRPRVMESEAGAEPVPAPG